jgi:3-mercaptopyruvate sulfurtransferase SseA
MFEKLVKKKGMYFAGLLGVLSLMLLAMWGCGTKGYDDPAASAVTTQTATALIQASDLKQWADAGLVNKAGGYDRVVILDISANAADGSNAYNTVGHIPGAQLISGGSAAFQDNTRAEGPLSVTGAMVCTGATIDTIIQNAGIDGNTTIVLTSNSANTTGAINVTRAYATFRYWGFPKNRLKVLDGGNAGWTSAGYALSTVVPSIQKSSYGVAQNGTTNINTDMRVSLSEMITYVTGIAAGNTNKVTVIDTVRGSTTVVNSKISGPTSDLLDTTKFTPFDGAMKGSYSYHATRMLRSGLFFKDAATIKADVSAAFGTDGITALGDANRDATRTFISLCRAGNFASVGYFALDGIAYYDSTVEVKWYDGSYGQWNLMASTDQAALNGTNAGGKLAVGSIWNTTSLMDNLTWNIDRAQIIVPYGSRVFGVEPSFAEGNQLEAADKAYRSTVTGTGGGTGDSGGGGC